jgi:hypothetical protein
MSRKEFFRTRKTKKVASPSVEIALTEYEAREFIESLKSFRKPALVRVAAKVAYKLGKISNRRRLGLLEVVK